MELTKWQVKAIEKLTGYEYYKAHNSFFETNGFYYSSDEVEYEATGKLKIHDLNDYSFSSESEPGIPKNWIPKLKSILNILY